MSPKCLKKQVALATFRRLLKIVNNKHTGLDVSFYYLKIFFLLIGLCRHQRQQSGKRKKRVKSCLFRHTNMVSPFFFLSYQVLKKHSRKALQEDEPIGLNKGSRSAKLAKMNAKPCRTLTTFFFFTFTHVSRLFQVIVVYRQKRFEEKLFWQCWCKNFKRSIFVCVRCVIFSRFICKCFV